MNTPVEELYASGVVAESDVEDILLLKTDQSAVVSSPRFVAEADGKLNVIVFPAPVMVKSEPEVEVANVAAPLVTCWPAGPTAVISELTVGKQLPFIAKQPAVILTPFAAVVVAPVSVSAPVIVVEALMVEDAEDTKPFVNVRVVVVALPINGYAKFA